MVTELLVAMFKTPESTTSPQTVVLGIVWAFAFQQDILIKISFKFKLQQKKLYFPQMKYYFYWEKDQKCQQC